MDVDLILSLVKARLNRLSSDTTLDSYLTARINAAIDELQNVNGIVLDANSNDDLLLVCDMVVWEYQNRDHNTGMPEWLRLRRRERWLKQAIYNESSEEESEEEEEEETEETEGAE